MWKDERGADTIPLKLVVYLAITGIIIAMAALGLKHAGPPMDSALMERQLGEITSTLESMQTGYARDLSDPNAAKGNIRSFELVLPGNLEYLSFGADPDPDNNGILTDTPPGLLTADGDVIYYKLRGSGKQLVRLNSQVRLREGMIKDGIWIPNEVDGLHQAVVITGGSQSITFELVHDGGDTYTLSHLTDEVDAYIKTDEKGALPHGLMVSVNPQSIPADGGATARVTVQVIDGKGRYVTAEGRIINLTSTMGNLDTLQVTTNSHGSGSVHLTSSEIGLGMVTARSPGLHEGSAQIALTLPPVEVEFNEWIMSSRSELRADFNINHDAVYQVTLVGWGTEASWPAMPEGWPIGRVEVDGMVLGENEVASGSLIRIPYGSVLLGEGTHSLKVTMTNDFNVPLVGDRNLYVEKIVFY